MNVFAKRALILTVLVLCLFGLTIFGVSAATGAADSGENSVASAVVDGTTLYYDDLATALAEADTGSTVTVLKDVALASTVVIDRADATLTLDLGGKTVTTADGVSLAIRLTAGTVTIKKVPLPQPLMPSIWAPRHLKRIPPWFLPLQVTLPLLL